MLGYILFASILGLVAGWGTLLCPHLEEKTPFDGKRFDGDWYVISSTLLDGLKLERCGIFTYNSTSDISLTYNGFGPNNEKHHLLSLAAPATNKPTSISQSVIKINGGKWMSLHEQAVLSTDYDKSTLFFACRPDFDQSTEQFGKILYGTIWSRTKTLDEETIKEYKKILATYEIPESDLMAVDQTNC